MSSNNNNTGDTTMSTILWLAAFAVACMIAGPVGTALAAATGVLAVQALWREVWRA